MRYRFILILVSLLVFGLVLGAVNTNAGSDPKFTLLVSQSIIDNGTIRLDAYKDDLLLGQPAYIHIDDETLIERGGHLYNYFPVGPSIMTLPIMMAFRSTGMDMRLVEDSFTLHKFLAAFTCVLMVNILYAIGRCYIRETPSLLIASVSVLGTTIISSMGTALWTINFSTIYIALSVLLISRYETKKSTTVHPLILGTLLFLAFFSRPSTVTFIVAAMAYILVKDHRQFLRAATVSLSFLLVFIVWSRLEFGTWLSTYYSVSRLEAGQFSLWIGLLGNLFSPSRGIFIFSPFFLLIFPGVLYVGRKLLRQPIVWMATSWFILSLILNANQTRAVVWWGGYSFGPRLLTESILALVLLLMVIWKSTSQRLRKRALHIVMAAFVILSTAAIFINSFQGLFNPDTAGWNAAVEPVGYLPDEGLGDLFDWRYPQFIATADRNCEHRYQRYQQLLSYGVTLEDYAWGAPISYYADQVLNLQQIAQGIQSAADTLAHPASMPSKYPAQVYLPALIKSANTALLVGWLEFDELKDYRVSTCTKSQIIFRANPGMTNEAYEFVLSVGAFGEQEVRVFLNGTKLGTLDINNPINEPGQYGIPFDGAVLNGDGYNEILFEFPGAFRPNPSSFQLWAIGYHWSAIYPVSDAPDWTETPRQDLLPAGYP